MFCIVIIMNTRLMLVTFVLSLMVFGLFSATPSAFAPYHKNQPFSVAIDKTSYNSGDTIMISGMGAGSVSISIQIISPSGQEITKLSTSITGVEQFSTNWIIPSGMEGGTYTIIASGATQTAQITFVLETESLSQKAESISETKKIPDWVKNNAGWWADGLIGDSDFVNGIQYLIKENIMVIPDLPEEVTQMELKDEKRAMGMEREQNVPDWVINIAGWWADGLISDDDFVSGIKYLVEQGIIKV